MDLKHRCSATGCQCNNFIGAKENLRICDGCNHSWLTHLLEKLVRSDESLSVLDVSSLALYGTHALPIRLKIVIERLLSTLDPDEIDKILRSFGWTPLDLARGYMIQDTDGDLLSRWSILPREEEPLVLEQFKRFSPTRNLTTALLKKEMDWDDEEQMIQDNSVLNLSSAASVISESTSGDEDPITPVDLSLKSETKSSTGENKARPDQESNHSNLSHDSVDLSKLAFSASNRTLFTSSSVHSSGNQNSGKRRVECPVCFKTFCDKGALKIHYSAVHLREMHQCTVAGCKMMFSSRRSRNRHSANPNPKLHTPHMKRKISPHDGRSNPGVCLNLNPQKLSFPSPLSTFGSLDVGKRDERISINHIEDIRKNGARKRKLANPIKLSPKLGDSYSVNTNDNEHSYDGISPLTPSESDPSSPVEPNNPLHCLATKVFNFNNHFQNLHLTGLSEKWCESLMGKPRLDFLFDSKPIIPVTIDP